MRPHQSFSLFARLMAAMIIGPSFATPSLSQDSGRTRHQSGWLKVSEPIKSCVNAALSSKKITVSDLINSGVEPADKRIQPLISSCDQILKVKLELNFPCSVTNSKGVQVNSNCDQAFARNVNGTLVAVSLSEFMQAAGNGEAVQVANFETTAAKMSRINAENNTRLTAQNQSSMAKPVSALPKAKPVSTAGSSKSQMSYYEKLAPPSSSGMAVARLKGGNLIGSVESCKLIHRVTFTDDTFRVLGPAPQKLSQIALASKLGWNQNYYFVSFSDQTVVNAESYSSLAVTKLKGFGNQSFGKRKYHSINSLQKSPMKSVIGNLEISQSYTEGETPKIGDVSVILFSVSGIINGVNIFAESSNPYGTAPMNEIYRSSNIDNWDYFVGVCRLTYLRQ